MLSAQEIANYLQTGLDEIGKNSPDVYEFSILAEIGKGYEGNKINGMVRTVSPELAPYPSGYVEAKYVFAVEMFVWGPDNYCYLNVNAIIDEFIKANEGSSVAFKNGKGVVTFTMGVPKGYKTEYHVGEGVPLTFTVQVNYTENGVTSGDKHWLLDGVEIPFLSESITVEREGIPRKIFTEVYSNILLTGQTKFYNFRIPYESATFKALQSELLQAPAVNEVVHTLTYYDGAAFTKENPFTAKVAIFRSASSGSTRPNASAYDVTFSDVYDPADKSVHYYLALIDFPFDMQGEDTRYFKSYQEQIFYFELRASGSDAPFAEIKAPNLDGLFITKQVYRKPAALAGSQFDLVNKNYAIIKVTIGIGVWYFFYFIENSSIGADGCIMVDLKLDTVQTYFLNDNISFSDCLIERAHLNRFVPVEGDPTKVKFVTDPASKIYNAEQGLNFPKRLVQRDKLKLRYTGGNTVDNWLDENVAYWVYIFTDPSKTYKTQDGNLTAEETEMGRNSFFSLFNPFVGATNVISYPVYKKARFGSTPSGCSNIIRFDSSWDEPETKIERTREYVAAFQGREGFESENNGTGYYYTIKLSCLPPFDTQIATLTVDSKDNLVIRTRPNHVPEIFAYRDNVGHIDIVVGNDKGDDSDDWISYVGGIETNDMYGVFFGSYQWTYDTQAKSSLKTFEYNLPENGEILKADIKKQQPPVLAYNPKLNSQNFKELVITASSGDTFAYDIQKLNDSSIIFEYSEPIQPEITKYYMRVQGGTGLYEDGTVENYTGLVGSTDTSLMYSLTNYDQFLANNKNFFLQSNMKIVSSAAQSTIGIVGQIAKGNYASAIESGLSAGVNLATSAIDRSLTIDNMKNAPDQLKNANGNVIFNMFVTDLGLYVEKYSALEGDLKTANDFMNLYGFSFGGIDNIRKYANVRKYYNYIKAQLQKIKGNISNVARADLRQRFANGVRFWNSDDVSYDYENYENWLDE